MLSLLVIFPQQHLKVVTLVLEWRACGQKTKCNATANVSSLFQAHFSQDSTQDDYRELIAEISSCHFMPAFKRLDDSHQLLFRLLFRATTSYDYLHLHICKYLIVSRGCLEGNGLKKLLLLLLDSCNFLEITPYVPFIRRLYTWRPFFALHCKSFRFFLQFWCFAHVEKALNLLEKLGENNVESNVEQSRSRFGNLLRSAFSVIYEPLSSPSLLLCEWGEMETSNKSDSQHCPHFARKKLVKLSLVI